LFGHEKGSFSGAIQQQKGKFEQASGGTLFLDEIGEMDIRVQPKVLRAIENGEIQRIGGNDNVKVDVRLIAATNRDLKEAVQKKEFRDDLFFRLSVINIHVPPLRERKEDIPLLAEYFMTSLCQQRKRLTIRLSSGAIDSLLVYPWPGNVRELRNLMEKIVVLSDSKIISGEEMNRYLNENRRSQIPVETNPGGERLSDIRKKQEKEAIESNLIASGWNYEKTAEELGIARSTLFSKLKEYGINRKNHNLL
jgi:DNA-binding NtrC family response regulator